LAGDVPAALCGVCILELDLGSLTAGCMMPGEFEERLKVGPQGLRV
jgi:ATP-dependent Clp protease ATP-binding subunit ClpB